MIVFDLRCANAHVFEAWFGSTTDYESQRERALIGCPVCGDTDIGKAVMAPAVSPKGNQRIEAPAAAHAPEEVKTMLAALAAVQAKVEESCDYVGDRFADEARAIHLGEVEARGIYGEATASEAEALREEGIEIALLPFRSKRTANA